MTDDARGVTRRDLLRRGGAVAVASVWVAPVVQSIGPSAMAAGSPEPPGVEPTKKGRPEPRDGAPETRVLGDQLPRTGNGVNLWEIAAIGAGMVGAGAAARKLAKNGDDPESGEPEPQT